jgi:thymidylate synthase
MRILVVTQGKWGERIAQHLRRTVPNDWLLSGWRGPVGLPLVIDDPDEFLPETLEPADLLLVLTESAGMTDLAPDVAALCGAMAVIVAVDARTWAPPGLVRQVRQRLERAGVDSAFPAPFCSLAPSDRQHELIRAFAEQYGRPELSCAVADGEIVSCAATREAPCGNTRYIAERLAGVAVERGPEEAGLLHHYFPCWGGMDGDPVRGEHTLLHVAATMSQNAVKRALEDADG